MMTNLISPNVTTFDNKDSLVTTLMLPNDTIEFTTKRYLHIKENAMVTHVRIAGFRNILITTILYAHQSAVINALFEIAKAYPNTSLERVLDGRIDPMRGFLELIELDYLENSGSVRFGVDKNGQMVATFDDDEQVYYLERNDTPEQAVLMVNAMVRQIKNQASINEEFVNAKQAISQLIADYSIEISKEGGSDDE